MLQIPVPSSPDLIADTARDFRVPSRASGVIEPARHNTGVSALGCLLGMAAGDAIGLPFEGMRPRRIAKLLGNKPLEHRFIAGRGMCSDDTEHACMTALSLIQSENNPDKFAKLLAWRLKWWFARLPAGIGLATLRASVKLWLGSSPQNAGVRSAGNGPCMRAPIIGLYALDNPELLKEFLIRSTMLTHNDTRALDGAYLIAIATRHACLHAGKRIDPEDFLVLAPQHVTDEQLLKNVGIAVSCAQAKQGPDAFLDALKLDKGVTGYINHTVPAAIYCWFRHPYDFRGAIEAAVRLGGDTDTVAAIVGGIMGASLGAGAIPETWLSGLTDWPLTREWMTRLAANLTNQPNGPEHNSTAGKDQAGELFWPAQMSRNFVFTGIVLSHAARRLLPPY
jgi:ADP-ribosyl-[dinitrogen reductase] hydrolase